MRRALFAAWFAAAFALIGCEDGATATRSSSGVPSAHPGSSDAGTGSGGGSELSEGSDGGGMLYEADATAPVSNQACDRTKPFRAPVLLPGFSPTFHAATPRLSRDELTIYFTGDGISGQGSDMFRATRASRTAPFDAPQPLTALNSATGDNDPAPSADHLSVWFHSVRSGNAELYFATRSSISTDFGAPALVPGVNDPTASDVHAYYRMGGGGQLWFTSTRGGNQFHIHFANKNGTGFDPPVLVSELAGSWYDWQPMVSEDGLTLLFSSTRPGGLGGFDLWLTTRATESAGWNPPAPLIELNSPTSEMAGWLSPDGCRIYFSSERDAAPDWNRLWVAERPL